MLEVDGGVLAGWELLQEGGACLGFALFIVLTKPDYLKTTGIKKTGINPVFSNLSARGR
ncbi:hypothetical protein [Alcaligenes faecalis]|uniref:Uncharacterized protein n=1 Tax=Alcaligenes faecalis TaxID=511 RepID=A0AAE9KML0_ALCFA|nr:hypothetical protein [Alcaligenes faecalis]UPL20418.1 hypothetical protein MXF72_13485 [Alcaligenes faecalis]